MRQLARILLLKPVLWAAKKFSSRPDRERVFKALSLLYEEILEQKKKKGVLIPFEVSSGKVIIFSDQHKGAKNGADDFAKSEKNYTAALTHYYNNDYFFISLGDSEELWKLPYRKSKNAMTTFSGWKRVSFKKDLSLKYSVIMICTGGMIRLQPGN